MKEELEEQIKEIKETTSRVQEHIFDLDKYFEN